MLEEKKSEQKETQIALEESFQYYNEGMQLLKRCNETIDSVEKKVLVLDEEGETYEF